MGITESSQHTEKTLRVSYHYMYGIDNSQDGS